MQSQEPPWGSWLAALEARLRRRVWFCELVFQRDIQCLVSWIFISKKMAEVEKGGAGDMSQGVYQERPHVVK